MRCLRTIGGEEAMLYSYICRECGEHTTVDIPAADLAGHEEPCPRCGRRMGRSFRTAIRIGAGDGADDIQTTSFAKERLRVRPSGKRKVLY